jgi:hypothetical protein
MLGVAGLAAHPQEAVFETTAFQVLVEFALDIARQFSALRRKIGGERRVVLLNYVVEWGLFGAVALVTDRSQFHANETRNVGEHGLGPCRNDCDSVFFAAYRSH